ncbi:MAG: nucleotidyltransferase domain-containing protein [Candidatus Hydrogenedentes bacterium]|nr:nucleotidyltransferase domain-containing protein [Candidatus Hydrogenedentota bacterium]
MEPPTKIINQVVHRIVKTARPRRIILFGSAARGKMRADSDLDILVVVRDGTHRTHTAQRIYEKLVGVDIDVDVVVATEQDLLKYGDNFSLVYYPALREGKQIYAA